MEKPPTENHGISEKDLIVDLARDAIESVAPDELPFFREYSEAFFRDPSRLLKQKSEYDPLGFGWGEVAELVTGTAIALAMIALDLLKDGARDALKSKIEASIGALIERLVKALRKPEAAAAQAGVLTPEVLKQLRERLIEHARRLGISEPKAAQLADAVVAAIVERLA